MQNAIGKAYFKRILYHGCENMEQLSAIFTYQYTPTFCFLHPWNEKKIDKFSYLVIDN